ncbi:MAG TPA: hypothetical protein V6C78_07085 [Crinalium sp.]|jgi:hypothetical protein
MRLYSDTTLYTESLTETLLPSAFHKLLRGEAIASKLSHTTIAICAPDGHTNSNSQDADWQQCDLATGKVALLPIVFAHPMGAQKQSVSKIELLARKNIIDGIASSPQKSLNATDA